MSVVVLGLSHRGTPVGVLERVALTPEAVDKLLVDAVASPHVAEAVVLGTCNRVEVYADVSRFHGAVDDLTRLLARHSGLSQSELTPYLYVRYEDGAVAHLFSVVCGLDSMVVGETQILGQVKTALRAAQDAETAGPVLNPLLQHALRVGKRAHTETDLGREGRSVVSAAFARAVQAVGSLDGAHVLVVGAGSMASLAATIARRDFGGRVTIANRSEGSAGRLARQVDGRAVRLDELATVMRTADVVVSCTGSVGTVISVDQVPRDRDLVVLDLALPHDVDPAVGELPGVTLIGLAELASGTSTAPPSPEGAHAGDRHEPDALEGASSAVVEEVRRIVAEEVAAFSTARRAATATPTVIALRSMAAQVVQGELERLASRLPGLDGETYAEVENTMRRVVDKLLHTPTIRVKQLAERPVQTSYTDALRELFALDPATIDMLSEPRPVDQADRVDQTDAVERADAVDQADAVERATVTEPDTVTDLVRGAGTGRARTERAEGTP